MKVKELKQILKDSLDTLKNYKPGDEVNLVSNTYFLHGARHFIGIAGYDGGYVDLDEPVSNKEDY